MNERTVGDEQAGALMDNWRHLYGRVRLLPLEQRAELVHCIADDVQDLKERTAALSRPSRFGGVAR